MTDLRRIMIVAVLLSVTPAGARADGAGTIAWTEQLAARGITSSATATGLWIGTVAGGLEKGGVYNTLGTATFEADLEKLARWPGASAGVDLYWIRGKSPSWYFVGDALTVSNLDGYDSIRLYKVWLRQEWAEGRWAMNVGVLGADEEFGGTETGGLFTNSAFGWLAGISANTVNSGPVYFAPGLGAHLAWQPREHWKLQAAIYDGDSFDSAGGDPSVNQHGFHLSMGGAQGTFSILEMTHDWPAGDGGALPGAAKFGLWRHSGEFGDNWADRNGESHVLSGADPVVHQGNHGWYGAFEQKLWASSKHPEQGVTAWLRVAGAPADRSAIEWATDAGFGWVGLVPGRSADVLGIGVATGYVSRAAQRAQLDAWARDGESGVLPDFERVVEATYRVHVGEHWAIAPGVQWVQHPGTCAEVPNAWVPLLRVSFE